jgi:hypothetical protein
MFLHRARVVVATLLVAIGLTVGVLGAPSAPSAAAATPNGPALLTAIDVQDLGTFDRVTFSFRTSVCIDVCDEPVQNPVPTIRRAEYVDRPILADASGMEVPVAGGAVLQLVLGGASAFDAEGNPPQPSYTGPTRIEANLPSIIEVVETGDFESVLSFAIGVRDGAAGGTAQVLTGPTRVIVDVPHVVTPVVVSPNFTG